MAESKESAPAEKANPSEASTTFNGTKATWAGLVDAPFTIGGQIEQNGGLTLANIATLGNRTRTKVMDVSNYFYAWWDNASKAKLVDMKDWRWFTAPVWPIGWTLNGIKKVLYGAASLPTTCMSEVSHRIGATLSSHSNYVQPRRSIVTDTYTEDPNPEAGKESFRVAA